MTQLKRLISSVIESSVLHHILLMISKAEGFQSLWGTTWKMTHRIGPLARSGSLFPSWCQWTPGGHLEPWYPMISWFELWYHSLTYDIIVHIYDILVLQSMIYHMWYHRSMISHVGCMISYSWIDDITAMISQNYDSIYMISHTHNYDIIGALQYAEYSIS
jgi:hypothetical protein